MLMSFFDVCVGGGATWRICVIFAVKDCPDHHAVGLCSREVILGNSRQIPTPVLHDGVNGLVALTPRGHSNTARPPGARAACGRLPGTSRAAAALGPPPFSPQVLLDCHRGGGADRAEWIPIATTTESPTPCKQAHGGPCEGSGWGLRPILCVCGRGLSQRLSQCSGWYFQVCAVMWVFRRELCTLLVHRRCSQISLQTCACAIFEIRLSCKRGLGFPCAVSCGVLCSVWGACFLFFGVGCAMLCAVGYCCAAAWLECVLVGASLCGPVCFDVDWFGFVLVGWFVLW